MSSKDRKATNTPPSSAPSSPSIGSKPKKSPNVNRKSVKYEVPKSFTIDVNQIAVARKQLKNVGKGNGHSAEQLASITLESPEKQGSLFLLHSTINLDDNSASLSGDSWTQLWCVLKEGRLYIFLNSKVPTPDKIVSLQGSKIEKKSASIDNCFQIASSGETLIFRTDEDFDYITWIVALRGATLYLKIATASKTSSSNMPPPSSTPPSTSPTSKRANEPPVTSATSPPLSPMNPTSPTSPVPSPLSLQGSSASPSLGRKNVHKSTSPFRNSADISKLPSRIQEISSPPTSYRKSADITKLSKSMDFSPLGDVISAAYRKSADLSKLNTSYLAPSPLSPPLFASAEIVSGEKDDSADVKTKRGHLGVPGGIFTKWKQRWVVLANDMLSVYKHEEDEGRQDKEPVHNFELIFCQPKVVQSEKGKFVFEIHAPGKTVQFGAPSSLELLDWINAIQETQTTLMQSYLQYNLNGDSKGKGEDGEGDKQQLELELEKSKKRLADIMKLPGNNQCADCGALDPLWATINFGVFICIECSGVHRQMGTHISKVRSITMDKWDDDVLEFMEGTGNIKVNADLEYNILPQYSKLTPNSSRQEREIFIKAKYEDKLFVDKNPPQ